jgi:Protein of unknown function (DUF3570)
MRRLSRTASSLLVSSLGLPGFTELMAADGDPNALQYRYTFYDEDPLPLNVLAGGDPDRYRIKSHQFSFKRELNEQFTLTVEGIHESMSGSSPWYVIPDPEHGPLQIMSGATISETRDEIMLALGIKKNDTVHSVAAGYSTENDYDALYANYTGEYEQKNKHTTLLWGFSYSDDRLSPTDAVLFGRVEHAEKNSVSTSFGMTRVINRNALIQSGVQITHQDGYLSDPYKEMWINGMIDFDHRPNRRSAFSWSTRFRQYLVGSNAALHADYRYYNDDWGVKAHTLDLVWNQPIGDNLELAPSVRYHSQRAANFYVPAVTDGLQPNYWSSDYRLATYGALRYRLSATWRAEIWSVALNADIYNSKESLALSGPHFDTPALVDFWRLSLGWQIHWQ